MSTTFYISYIALWVLVIFQSLILLGLVRIVYQLQQNSVGAGNNGVDIISGREAPPFNTVDLSGAPINSANFAGHLTALLFVAPDCSGCTAVLEDDVEYLKRKAQDNVIVICRAGREDCIRLAEQHRLNIPLIADEDNKISRLYNVSSVPTAVFINANNRIQFYGHPQREGLEEMFDEAAEAQTQGVG